MESPIKEIRVQLGFTQRQMAILAKVSQSHISDVESGISDINSRLKSYLLNLKCNIEDLEQKQNDFLKLTRNQLNERSNKQSLAGE